MSAITKIRMKKELRVSASPGAIMLAKIGQVIEVQDFTADGLVEQGFADYVKEVEMVRTVEPETKAEKKAPKNKDEGGAPDDKDYGFEKKDKKVRVHELARDLGVSSHDILFQAAQLGFDATTSASTLTPEEAHEIIKSMKDN